MSHKKKNRNTANVATEPTIAALRSAISLYFNGRYSDGLAEMKHLLREQPRNVDALNVAAVCARAMGELAEAESLLTRAIDVKPDYSDAHNNLGSLQHSLGRFAEAEAAYLRAIATRPGYAEAHFNLALLYQTSSRLDEAELGYKRAIELRPDYAEAYMNLGNILKLRNRLLESESAYRSAVSARPNYADAHNNLGLLLRQIGRRNDAETAFQTALSIQSDYIDAQCNLGILFMEDDRYHEAEAVFRKVLAINPASAISAHNLGKTLKELGRIAEAEAAFYQALKIQPSHADALCDLGTLFSEFDRLSEAENSYRAAIASQPEHVPSYCNLGNLLLKLQRLPEAETAYRQALALQPDNANTYFNLANLLVVEKRFSEAEAAYERVLEFQPNQTEALNNLGLLLMELGRMQEAEAVFQQALAIRPNFADAHNNLGILFVECARFPEAEAAFSAAVRYKPDHGFAVGQIDHVRRFQCAWPSLTGSERAITSLLDTGRTTEISPFGLIAIPATTPHLQRQAGKLYAERFFRTAPPAGLVNTRATPKNRLRIGYLSADFHEHATAFLLSGVLDRHDRDSVSIYLYSYGPNSSAPIRQRLVAASECFRDLRSISDIEAAKQIADDDVDILVDLKGYTGHTRLGITALRPAPVIVSWLGYPGTLGDPRLADYLIGDPVVTPLAHASHFSETLALMPHCYQPTDCNRAIGKKPHRVEAGLPETGFVFCSFNQSYKFNPTTFSLWCSLMEEVPESVLWLLEPNGNAIANLRKEAKVRAIDPDRLIFAPRLPQTDHLGRLQLADLALDTFPCTSHTTGSDALWAGVPLVTKIGDTFASRVAASLLHSVGLPELVTYSDAEYFDLALSLARRSERLTEIRENLHANRLNCSLFDTDLFTKDLERLYFEVWTQHNVGKRTAFALPPSERGK